jgi:hypothetical protein
MTYISHSNTYFDVAQVEEKSAAMSMAITRALADAGITSKGPAEEATKPKNAL